MCSQCDKDRRCKKEKKCKDVVLISACDINNAAKRSVKGFVISKPGKYELCEDVDWKAVFPVASAISIEASNVDLLFNGHYLRQVDHSLSNTSAVHIINAVSNVKISGGSVTEISGQGVLVDPGCSNVEVSDMNFSKIGYRGSLTTVVIPIIFVRETSGVIAANSNPDQARVRGLRIVRCEFNDNGILDGVFPAGTNFGAIFTNFAEDVSVTDCNFRNMFGVDFSTAFIPINTENTIMARCSIRDVIGYREALGFAPTICQAGLYEDITIQNLVLNLKANAPEAHGAEGAKLSECTDFVVRRCVAQDIHVQSLEPTVQTEDNTLVSQGFGTGSLLNPCKNVLFEDCIAQGITNDGGLLQTNGPFVRTGGFTMQGGTNNCRFVNCSAENVTATVGRVMGFGTKRFKNTPDISFVNCVATDIRGQSNGDGEYAAGFHLNSQRELVSGCLARNVTHSNGQGYGIVLDREQYPPEPLTEARSCILQNNKVEFNSTNGIADLTLAKDSVISGTYAAFSGAANYAGLNPVTYTTATTQQDWQLPNPPAPLPSAGAALVNVDVHY